MGKCFSSFLKCFSKSKMKETPKKDQEEVLHLNPSDIRIEIPSKPSDIKNEIPSKPSDIEKEIPPKISEIKKDNKPPIIENKQKKKRKHNKSKSYESFLEIKPENEITTSKRCSISRISDKVVVDIKNLLAQKIEIPVKKPKILEIKRRKKNIVYNSKSS